jgi:SAM-dependent methyltransferase
MKASLDMNAAARKTCREVRLRHWTRWLSPETGPKAVVEERLRPDRALADWAVRALPDRAVKVRILDLAPGPLTAIGPQASGLEVDVVAIDDLAQPLNELLSVQRLTAPVPVQFGTIEDVLTRFGPESFDLITSFNGMDFTDDPIACYRQLIPCLKPGGAIITFHEIPEDSRRLENEWFRYFHLVKKGRIVIGQRGYLRDLRDALPEAEIRHAREGSLVRVEIQAAAGPPDVRPPQVIDGRGELPAIRSVHIPKTAGSSFRRFLEDLYGDGLRCLYDPWDPEAERELDPGSRCLHGHFPADAFDRYLPDAINLIWVRDPVERLVSCYFQFHRHPESAGESAFNRRIFEEGWSLIEFARQPEMRRQVRWYFNAVPLDDFFFIGVTERYAESMRLLCHQLGRPVPDSLPRDNTNPDKQPGNRYALPPARRAELECLLAEEIELYRFINYRLDRQVAIAFGGA